MRNKYEDVVFSSPVPVYSVDLPEGYKGLYVETGSEQLILISRSVDLYCEKVCVLAEELGHHFTSAGVIVNQRPVTNRKQEMLARTWAYMYLCPLDKFIEAHKEGIRNRYELAEFFGVTEDFLDSAIKRYQEKYGKSVYHDGYTICFNPLGVAEWFED